MPESVPLTAEDKALLMKVSNLVEESVVTVNILEDKEAKASIKRAEKDV